MNQQFADGIQLALERCGGADQLRTVPAIIVLSDRTGWFGVQLLKDFVKSSAVNIDPVQSPDAGVELAQCVSEGG